MDHETERLAAVREAVIELETTTAAFTDTTGQKRRLVTGTHSYSGALIARLVEQPHGLWGSFRASPAAVLVDEVVVAGAMVAFPALIFARQVNVLSAGEATVALALAAVAGAVAWLDFTALRYTRDRSDIRPASRVSGALVVDRRLHDLDRPGAATAAAAWREALTAAFVVEQAADREKQLAETATKAGQEQIAASAESVHATLEEALGVFVERASEYSRLLDQAEANDLLNETLQGTVTGRALNAAEVMDTFAQVSLATLTELNSTFTELNSRHLPATTRRLER